MSTRKSWRARAKPATLKGKHKEKEFPIGKYETTVGRTTDNDICLHDWFVSKKHASIIRQGNNFFIKDLGSWKGTFVNEKQIRDTALNHNDTIQIGTSKFRFLIEEVEEAKGRVPLELPVDESYFGVPTAKKEKEITPHFEESSTPTSSEITPEHEEKEEILITDKDESLTKEGKEEIEVFQSSLEKSVENELSEPVPESAFEFQESVPSFNYEFFGKEKEPLKDKIFSDESVSFENLEEVNPPEEPSSKISPKETVEKGEAEAKKEFQFVGNKNDNTYHKTDCKKVNDIEEFDKIFLADKASAKSEGLNPCELCLAEKKPSEEVKVDEEVELWLSALQSKSSIIREHAKKRLKKLTGIEYD